MAQARSERAINLREKKRGSVTYSTDRENEVSKIFILSLRLIGRAEKEISMNLTLKRPLAIERGQQLFLQSVTLLEEISLVHQNHLQHS